MSLNNKKVIELMFPLYFAALQIQTLYDKICFMNIKKHFDGISSFVIETNFVLKSIKKYIKNYN